MKKFFLLSAVLSFTLLLASCGGERSWATANERDGKLLCAANCAIAIGPDGAFAKPEPYFTGTGFLDAPATVTAGPSGIYGAIIGTIPGGVVVAFRGTPPPANVNQATFTDWLNNLIGLAPVQPAGFTGKIHPGFWKGVDALLPKILPEIRKRIQKDGKVQPLYFTGFGKGGAMAVLAGVHLSHSGDLTVTEVITFSAPLAGDTAFARHDAKNIKLLKYVAEGDIVPMLPPDESFINLMEDNADFFPVFDRARDWAYDEFGKETFLRSGKEKASPMIKARKAALLAKISEGEAGFKEIVAAHNCACGSVYWKLLCVGMVCE